MNPHCLTLERHTVAWAIFRAFCRLGIRIPISSAIVAITTRSSMRVNALRLLMIRVQPSSRRKTGHFCHHLFPFTAFLILSCRQSDVCRESRPDSFSTRYAKPLPSTNPANHRNGPAQFRLRLPRGVGPDRPWLMVSKRSCRLDVGHTYELRIGAPAVVCRGLGFPTPKHVESQNLASLPGGKIRLSPCGRVHYMVPCRKRSVASHHLVSEIRHLAPDDVGDKEEHPRTFGTYN